MAQGVMTGRQPEVMREVLEAQMNRCREELKRADHFGKLGDIESARRRFDRVRAMVKDARFPADYLNELKESIRQIEITGLKKLTDQLLERASDCARTDDVAGRAAAIKDAREHIGRVMALGADDTFRDVSEKKIEVAMMTSSREATAAPKAYAAAPRAAFTAAEKAAVQREQRRFKRFSQPPLVVDVDGRRFATLNWSIGGMALIGWPPEWDSKTRIQITFSAEGDDMRFAEAGQFLRVFGETRNASVQFESVHSQALKLVQRLTGLGRVPQE
jgi:Fe-S cluster assembly scaffold protein SufB